MSIPWYLDDLSLKEYDMPKSINTPNPNELLREMISGQHDWHELMEKHMKFLPNSLDSNLVRYWKVIRDGADLMDITNIIAIKQANDKSSDTDANMEIVAEFFGEEFAFGYQITWIEIFRRLRQRLERIVQTYQTDMSYIKLNEIFDHAGTAQELLNDLLMLQTRPIGEAHIYLDIDEYTGIHEERDEYIKVPDNVTLENAEGEPTKVSLKELKNNGWSGDLSDPDHDWYDEDAEGELPSQSMWQWENQELVVTSEYWRLKTRYLPALMEFVRRIEKGSRPIEIENSRLSIWLKHALKTEFRNGVPVQDIAAFLAVDMPIELKVNGNISTVLDQFEDDILDSIPEKAGIYDCSENEYEPILEEFHKQTVKLLAEKGIKYSPKWSPIFIVSAFKCIVEDQLDVNKAVSVAYDDFREAVSPAGASAFRQAIESGEAPAKAMRAFYNAAKSAGEYIARDRVSSASNNGVVLLTASSGYSQNRSVTWSLFRYKAMQGEVFVPKNAKKSSKDWLKNKLKALCWSNQLIAKLSE